MTDAKYRFQVKKLKADSVSEWRELDWVGMPKQIRQFFNQIYTQKPLEVTYRFSKNVYTYQRGIVTRTEGTPRLKRWLSSAVRYDIVDPTEPMHDHMIALLQDNESLILQGVVYLRQDVGGTEEIEWPESPED